MQREHIIAMAHGSKRNGKYQLAWDKCATSEMQSLGREFCAQHPNHHVIEGRDDEGVLVPMTNARLDYFANEFPVRERPPTRT